MTTLPPKPRERFIACCVCEETFMEAAYQCPWDAFSHACYFAYLFPDCPVWVEHEVGDERYNLAVFQNSDEDQEE